MVVILFTMGRLAVVFCQLRAEYAVRFCQYT